MSFLTDDFSKGSVTIRNPKAIFGFFIFARRFKILVDDQPIIEGKVKRFSNDAAPIADGVIEATILCEMANDLELNEAGKTLRGLLDIMEQQEADLPAT